MKKGKIIAGLLAILIITAAYIMPRMVQSSIPSSYYVTPSRQTYENKISCTGTIQSTQVQSVYMEVPFVAADIYVQVGDIVNAGDALMMVDLEKSEALSGQNLVREFSSQSLEELEIQTASIDWASLASLYGLSAVVNSGSGNLDLEGLLEGVSNLETDTVEVAASTGLPQWVTSPITGVVTSVNVQQDVPVSAGKTLVAVSDNQNYKVMATVGEADIAKIKVGDEAIIRGVAFSNVYNGTVTKIYPTARKILSGTTTETVVDVEIELHNGNGQLKPGFTAKVEIVGDEDYNLLTVPYEAIRQDDNNDEYVYVYEEGRVQKTLVVTGQELTNEVQILSGLSSDSIVIYNPGSIVKEGSMIHIKGRADDD